MFKSGIYCIRNIIDNKVYIGSAINLQKRWNRHVSHLNHNKHHSIRLQKAFNKYGKSNFAFEVLDYVSNPNNLIKYEQLWLNQLKPEYNICKIAGSCLGTKQSKETKQKRSLTLKGHVVTLKTREKLSIINKEKCKGSKNPNAKLNDLIVKEIREKYKSGNYSLSTLAEEVGVLKAQIWKIVRNKSWI